MNEKLAKLLTYITGIIGLIGFIFFIRVVMAGDEAITDDAAVQNSIVSPFITFSIILLIASGVIAVVYSLLNLMKDTAVLKRTLMGVGILAVLMIIAYIPASSDAVTDQLGKILEGGEEGNASKWISTLINYSFILGAIGLVMFLWDFVKGIVK